MGVPASPSGHSAEPEPQVSQGLGHSASVPNAVAGSFEFIGQVLAMIVLAVAVLLAAPFMLLGWLIARAGADL
jgi:hypothetical protein